MTSPSSAPLYGNTATAPWIEPLRQWKAYFICGCLATSNRLNTSNKMHWMNSYFAYHQFQFSQKTWENTAIVTNLQRRCNSGTENFFPEMLESKLPTVFLTTSKYFSVCFLQATVRYVSVGHQSRTLTVMHSQHHLICSLLSGLVTRPDYRLCSERILFRVTPWISFPVSSVCSSLEQFWSRFDFHDLDTLEDYKASYCVDMP